MDTFCELLILTQLVGDTFCLKVQVRTGNECPIDTFKSGVFKLDVV